jgi:ATP-binding cassette, subfamily B, bacterial PglK
MSKTFKSIYSCLDRRLKTYLFIMILLSIIVPILELVGVAAIIPIIQISLNDFNFPEHHFLDVFFKIFTDEMNESLIIYLMIFFIFIFFVFKAFFLIFSEKFKLKYIKSLQDNFSIKLYNTYIFSKYEDFSNLKFTEKNRNIGTVGSLTDYLNSCNQILVETLFFLFIFSFLLQYSFKISLVVFAIFVVISVIIYLLSKTKLLKYSSIRHSSSAKVVGNLLDVFYSLKEVIILKRRNLFKNQFEINYSSMTQSSYKDGLIKFIPRNILELTVVSVILIIITYIFFNNLSINDNLELLGVFTFAMLKISLSANKLLLAFQNLKSVKIPAKEISKELIMFSHEEYNLQNQNENNKNKLEFKKNINLKNINFTYSDSSKETLRDINLEIKKNKTIGLSGPSGSGKTTLINLILGFLKPTTGKVLLDNFDIHTDVLSWHNSIAYVPQDIFLFNDSIKKNILFGLDEKKIDNKEFDRVLKIVNLDEFINRLDKGLDTNAGEKAAKLSGGQAQRIGIARSILLDKEILFLDEATSKLDESNEYEIIQNLIEKLGGKKTIIIISHRDKTLEKFCDEIYDLSNNKLTLKYTKKL